MTSALTTPIRVFIYSLTSDPLEIVPIVFDAVTDGSLWNGWECPRFDFDTTMALGVAMVNSGQIAAYDPDRDVFITMDQTDLSFDELATYDGAPGGLPVTYEDLFTEWTRMNDRFAVGAWGWVWEEFVETEPIPFPVA